MSWLMMLWVPTASALDAHGFSFEGVTGDVEDYARQGYPVAGVFGDGDLNLIFDYARDPLTEVTPNGREPVLSALGTANLAGAFSFGSMRLEVALPLHPIGTDPSGDFMAFGDARLGAMVPIPWLGPKIPLMALHTVVSFPTGSGEHFVSAEGVRFLGTALVAHEFGPVGLIGTVGGVVSRPEEDRNLKAGAGPVLGLGTSYRVDERFSAALEFTGESEYGFTSFPVEATLSGRYRSPLGAWATAGAAAGLSSGVGASRWRVFAGVGWSFREENHLNLEPVTEMDPDSDRDQDTLVDAKDACPDQPETVDGFEDADGCPELDGDGDGVPFARDLCPSQPIHREQDPRYSDGCPRLAELSGDHIVITETIYFKEGRADLLPASEHVLTAVQEVLEQHPKLGPLLIEGHTNTNGSSEFNLRLSDARAFAVMNWLVDHGVDPNRLISKGYGESRPLVPETDPDAEQVNRRVEFRVLAISNQADGGRQLLLTPSELAARRAPPPEPPKAEPPNKRGKKTEESSKSAITAVKAETPTEVAPKTEAATPPKGTTEAKTSGPAPTPESAAPPKETEPVSGTSATETVQTAAAAAPKAEPPAETTPAPEAQPEAAPTAETVAPPPAEPKKPSRKSRRSADTTDHH